MDQCEFRIWTFAKVDPHYSAHVISYYKGVLV